MAEKQVVTQEVKFTPQMIEELNDGIGMELRVSNVFNQTVSFEAIDLRNNHLSGSTTSDPGKAQR